MDHPRIEVNARRAPRRCVMCHDAVGDAPSVCDGCGAVYHRSCRPPSTCATPACAERGAASAAERRPAPPPTRAPGGAWLGWRAYLAMAVLAVGLVLEGASRWDRAAEAARREAEHARRDRVLAVRLASLSAELRKVDALLQEPYRARELEALRRRGGEVALELGAWDHPATRAFFAEVEAAKRRAR